MVKHVYYTSRNFIKICTTVRDYGWKYMWKQSFDFRFKISLNTKDIACYILKSHSLKYTWSEIFSRTHCNCVAIRMWSPELTRMVKARPQVNLLYGRKLPEVNIEARPTDTNIRNKLPAMRIFQSIAKKLLKDESAD